MKKIFSPQILFQKQRRADIEQQQRRHQKMSQIEKIVKEHPGVFTLKRKHMQYFHGRGADQYGQCPVGNSVFFRNKEPSGDKKSAAGHND